MSAFYTFNEFFLSFEMFEQKFISYSVFYAITIGVRKLLKKYELMKNKFFMLYSRGFNDALFGIF